MSAPQNVFVLELQLRVGKSKSKTTKKKKIRPYISPVVHKFDVRRHNLRPVVSHRSLQCSGENLNPIVVIRKTGAV